MCLAVADVRYPPKSIEANSIWYSGGYAGYTLSVNVLCGEGEHKLLNVGTEENSRLVLTMIGPSFCIHHPSYVGQNATGGAFFLLITICVSFSYFICGILWNFLRHGYVMIPNYPFWREFCRCVCQGLDWITLRKFNSILLNQDYSNI